MIRRSARAARASQGMKVEAEAIAVETSEVERSSPVRRHGPPRLAEENPMEAAGFVLDAESTMLANKDNPHSIKGETDRFAYRFVKP
jgi:hypothetical protein